MSKPIREPREDVDGIIISNIKLIEKEIAKRKDLIEKMEESIKEGELTLEILKDML